MPLYVVAYNVSSFRVTWPTTTFLWMSLCCYYCWCIVVD